MRPRPTDALLALLLAGVMQAEVWVRGMPGVGEVTGSRPTLAVTAVLMTLPLVWRRRTPLSVLAAVTVAAAAQQLLTMPLEGLAGLVTVLVGSYSASAHSRPDRALVSGVATAVAVAAMGFAWGDVAFLAVIMGAAWLTGFVVAQRTDQVHRLADDNSTLVERLEHAAALLAEADRNRAPAAAIPGLTARELEVAREIARGLTNAEIAATLVISEWTVKTHVASILRKLGLRDRAQVVVAAYESGVVVPRS